MSTVPSADHSHRYAGFWIRAGSQILDALITIPFILVHAFMLNAYRLGALYTFVPFEGLHLFYSVYLVYRFGGTPGKLLMAIRITSLDGSPVTLRQAFIREAPALAMSTLATLGQCLALFQVTDAEFYARSWLDRQRYIAQFDPGWLFWVIVVMQLWTWSELIVMLTNRARRALHDFIAGTVVIKKEFAEPIAVPVSG